MNLIASMGTVVDASRARARVPLYVTCATEGARAHRVPVQELIDSARRYIATINRRGMPQAAQVFEGLVQFAERAAQQQEVRNGHRD